MMRLDPKDIRSNVQLLKSARNGDRNAFGQLVSIHYRSCVDVATSILRERSEAEDKVQEAVWKAFAHLDQYLGEAEFFSWLIRIVVNECRMLLRNRKRAQFLSLNTGHNGGEDRQGELLSRAADPEYQVVKGEMIDVLKTEIRHIPRLFREVILLRDVNELTIHEVAYRLGITVSAAKSRLLRGRKELRRRVTSRFGPVRHMMPLSSERTLPARHVHGSRFAA